MVWKTNVVSNHIFAGFQDTNNRHAYTSLDFYRHRLAGGGDTIGYTTIYATGTDHILTYTRDAVGSSGITTYKDGSAVNNGLDTSINTDAITRFFLFTDGDGAGGEWDGWISEIICYAKILTKSELASVHSYLKNKYGI